MRSIDDNISLSTERFLEKIVFQLFKGRVISFRSFIPFSKFTSSILRRVFGLIIIIEINRNLFKLLSKNRIQI